MDYEWIYYQLNKMTMIYSKNGLDSVREYLLDFIKANLLKEKELICN